MNECDAVGSVIASLGRRFGVGTGDGNPGFWSPVNERLSVDAYARESIVNVGFLIPYLSFSSLSKCFVPYDLLAK